MITVRKLQLTIIEENEQLRKDKYKFIRDSIYAQYQGLNRCMGYLMSGYYACGMDIKSDEFKAHQKTITNSLSVFNDIDFGKGIDSKSSITQKIKKDFSTALKNGLAKGERSVANYKRDFPLMTRGRNLNFYEENENYYIKWVNNITFKVVLSRKEHKNYAELQHTLRKILIGEYKVNQSSLCFNRKNKLILNLNLTIPDNLEKDLIPGRVVGVDLGIKIPAYCTLNDNDYIKQAIGSIDDMLRVRQQFAARKRRLMKKLSLTQGYRKRLKSAELNNLSEKERNYAKTYNHMVSKRIIEFAIKNKAEQINLELLSIDKGGDNGAIIRYWGYYQIQEMIQYKAERAGIKVAFIDPYHTSQTCSCCGHYESGQRIDQETFICKKCGQEMNADFNASKNIAMSNKYITKKEQSEYYKKKDTA